jgi:rRNA-processing protein FCF1
MRVVVDANLITERDWFLRGASAEALLAAALRARVRLVVPEVVVREVATAHSERRAAAQSRLRAAQRDLRRLEGPLASDEAEVAVTDPFVRQAYDSWLRQRLRDHRVEIPPIPEASASLVDRALRRRRPFDAKGKGFRDALIWETVLGSASDTVVTVLATDNINDFGDDGSEGLHPDLLEDITGKGLSDGAVRLVRSLDAAAHLALEPAREVLDRLRARLDDEPEWSDELLDRMRVEVQNEWPAIDDAGVSFDIESRAEPFETEIVGSELEDLTLSGPPTAVDAFPLTEDVYAVVLEASADAVYRVEVSTSGFSRRPHRVPTGLDLSRDEDIAYFAGFADVTALFDARFDVRTEELTELSLMGLADT